MGTYAATRETPLGTVVMTAADGAVTGLWFTERQRHAPQLPAELNGQGYPVLDELAAWLDAYFAGENPSVDFPLAPRGTPFRESVWAALRGIPYGQTTSYRAVAEGLSPTGSRGGARAVGLAVGLNPIGIVIPCHRVIGADGSLTGYGGGLDRKEYLLRLEGSLANMRR
jgi:methylated-DNA-[protein]-cysteine S-methyltransferase